MQKSIYVDDYYKQFWDKLEEEVKEDKENRLSVSYLVNRAVMIYVNEQK